MINLLSMFRYDPKNISEYFGKAFSTHNGLVYTIDEKGVIRSAIDANSGSTVEMIAGMPDDSRIYWEAISSVLNKAQFDNLVLKHGKRPSKNRDLIISVSEADFQRTGIAGIVTGAVSEIKSA